MRRTLTIITALVALTALAMPATGLAAKNKTVKVKKDAKVKFNWGSGNANTHNVTLKKGPKGVKKSKPCTGGKITQCNKSGSGAIGIKFNPKFNKKGTYNFVCTIHPTTMKVKVVVK